VGASDVEGEFDDSATAVDEDEGRRWENQVDRRVGKVSPFRALFAEFESVDELAG